MKSRLPTLLLLVTFLLAAACAPGQESGRQQGVPLNVVYGPSGSASILVPVMVERRGPYLFLLDTGASQTVIDWQLANRLNLPVAGRFGTGTAAVMPPTLIQIADWRIGDVDLAPTTVATADLSDLGLGVRVEGILGADVLNRFGAVTVDLRQGQLTIRQRAEEEGGGAGFLSLEQWPMWLNIVLFIIASAAIWMAGTRLSNYADIISDRTGLGQAFIGLLLLATATSLPELATTLTATLIGNVPLAVANMLGGVSMQTTILAVLDGVVVYGALTQRAPHPVLLLHGMLLITMLTIALMGLAVPASMSIFGVGLPTVAIFVIYLFGMYASQRYGKHPQWQPVDPPAQQRQPQAELKRQGEEEASQQDQQNQQDQQDQQGQQAEGGHQDQLKQKYKDTPTKKIYWYFAAGAAAILVAGWLIAQIGDALAKQTGLGGTIVGFVLVAIATSLPEVSTTYTAVKYGAYAMAISNIFGGNAFDTALLFVADVAYREGPILMAVEPWAGFAAGLGIVLTIFYLWGLVERQDRTIFGVGIDSALVLVTYIAGLIVLYLIR